MPLKPPNLDDRDFQKLLEAAKAVIREKCPQWTDLSPHDPGVTLLEAFAYLTEVMIYRLNRLPEKAYIEFLRLLGAQLYPPAAAGVDLVFSTARPREREIEIPRGTRITTGRAGGGKEGPVFVTAQGARLNPGAEGVTVRAYHCDQIDGELAGVATGAPGQRFVVSRPPVVAPSPDKLDLIVGVEAGPGELAERVAAREFGGKTYRLWHEVRNLAEVGEDPYVYLADRLSGTITFVPGLRLPDEAGQLPAFPERIAAAPAAGREVRVWYRRGGGPEGNLAPGALNAFRDPIPGVDVSNPAAATGGCAAETLENAMLRGPRELYSLQRAVTAGDFEQFAEQERGVVDRARAFTKATLWKHATPGTVEVVLTPTYLEPGQRGNGAVTAELLRQQETETARERIQQALDERRPLGTTCLVNWAKYKTVQAQARIITHRGEDPVAVRARVLDRLHQTINPLRTTLRPGGWNFGEPLRPFDVYDTVRGESGVRRIEDVRFVVLDGAPDQKVSVIAADPSQPQTWYAGAGSSLFRSLNNGAGWERAGLFEPDVVEVIRPHRGKPGLLGIVTSPQHGGSATIHLSWDCGESWRRVAQLEFGVNDLAWMTRDNAPTLLMATDKGLYELTLNAGAGPVQILVDGARQSLGFNAIAATTTIRGTSMVAVAGKENSGVFLSDQGGRGGSFRPVGPTPGAGGAGYDIRVLEIQEDGPNSFLWAGVAVSNNEPERGAFRLNLEGSAEGWRNYIRKWTGGSCKALAFLGARVFAATFHAGVIWLDATREDAEWQAPDINCGLPMRAAEKNRIFHPVEALAMRNDDKLLMAGGVQGVFRGAPDGNHYVRCSDHVFTGNVTIPPTWLFCSGAHEITVTPDDEI